MNTGIEDNDVDDDDEKELSMREVMEEAIDDIDDEAGELGEVGEVVEKVAAEKEPKEKIEEGEHVEKTSKVEAKEKKGAKDVDIKPGAEEEGKAPQSWSPKLREQFGKLDPGVQAQINKRETEMNKALNEGAESRKLGESINKIVQPYKSVMAADGFNDPLQAINGLMNTAAQLRMGTPQQKAERLAQLIQHYGVDIETLDNVLSGANPQQSPNNDMQALIQKELAPVQQFMSSFQQNTQDNAQDKVTTFEKDAEFISDVRNDMADLLDMAANRNEQMTLQQAYDKACAINPEINGILQQRTADERIIGSADKIRNKRQAASSINGKQVGQQTGPVDDSIEATLRQAWDDSSRG